MRWIKRIAWGLGGLLAMVMLAALGARHWFVRQIPRLRAEADAAWAKAALPISELPRRFPDTEKNDDARWLEAMAARLEIPVFSDPECRYKLMNPDHWRDDEKVEDSLMIRCATAAEKVHDSELHDELRDYLNGQLPSQSGNPLPPSPALVAYLERHATELDEARAGLIVRHAVWERRYGWKMGEPDELMLLRLSRVLVAEALWRMSQSPAWSPAESLRAIGVIRGIFGSNAYDVDVLLAIVVERSELALVRLCAVRNLDCRAPAGQAYRDAVALSAEYTPALMTSAETLRIFRANDYEPLKGKLFKPINLLWHWFGRPWSEASVLDLSRLQAEDAAEQRSFTACIPLRKTAGEAGVSNDEVPRHHPRMARWNKIGPIIYGISSEIGNTRAIRGRISKIELERELTERVRIIARVKNGDGTYPETVELPPSVCGADRWRYAPTESGGAVLEFRDPPDFGTIKGPQIPLRFEFAAPAK